MKKKLETFILENLNYTQFMLHDLDETRFSAYTKLYHGTGVQPIYSYTMNLIYQLEERGVLNDTYLESICQFLEFEQITNIDMLINKLSTRRSQSEGLIPLTLIEMQNMTQCIKFIARDNCIDLSRIYNISEMTNTVRKMKHY